MAGIKSLALKGIRSFGTEECDEQKISFEKPLTLILGQNGCGKTTIIECLRYAITGQMPPGSRNECFVHDAKVNRSSEVLAQVRLKIVNARDKQLEVIRSMKVTVAKNKTKFTTLDSMLSILDDNGTPKDISSRCTDLDRVMHEELGVSKAIMNSVIFCHQDDSGWPLEEGKKVKERFDEIFDSDKYSDCFDRLRKLRKEYTTSIKLLEQEVSFLTEKKQELDKKKLEVVNTESKISEAELKITELTAELKPVTEKLKAIDTLQKNLVAFESKKDKAKNRLEQCRKDEVELKKVIKTLFQGTTPELETEISTYSTTMKTKDKELQDSYKKNNSFNLMEEKTANEKQNAEVKKNKYQLLEGQNQERIDKRNQLIVETAQVADMVMEPITNDEEAKKGIDAITEKINSLSVAMSEQRAVYDGEEKTLQAAVNESRDELSRHNQKISNKETEIKTAQKDMDKVQKDIDKAVKSKDKLEEVEAKLAKAEEDYQALEAELNHEETQKEINEDEKSLEEKEKELDELSDKISKLQKARTKLKEKEMVEEQLQQKEKQFNVLMNKHKSTLAELLGTVPESGFNVALNKLELEFKKEIDALKKKSKEKALEKRTLETERKHAKETLTERRSELSKAEDQMYKACGPQPYDVTLSKVSAEVERLQEEKNVLNSSMHIFKKYKSQLKENSCCPLCNRNFDSENEVTDLVTELSTQVMNVPANLEMVTEQLQRNTAKKDELISLKSVNAKISTLKETTIPQLEAKLTEVDLKLTEVTEAADEITKNLVEPEQKMQKSKQIHGEMPLLDRYVQEIKTTTKELEAKKAQVQDVDTDITLEDAETKQKDLKQSVNTLRQKIKATQQKLNAHAKKLKQMADKKNKIKEEVLDIQKKVQEIVTLQDKLKQLEENKQKYTEELEELKNAKSPLEDVVKEKENIKAEAVEKNRLAIEEKRSVITKINTAFEKVKSVIQEIKSHDKKKIPLEIEKAQKDIDKLLEKQKQIMIDRDTLTKKIDTLKDEIAKSEIYKRDLEDNLKLRKALEGIEKCEAELKEVHEKLSGVNIDMLSEKEGLIKQQTDYFKQKASTEGELRVQQEILKKAKQELQKPKNKDVDQIFKEKLYEMHAIKAIDNDVKEYSVALEKCVMEFHREKMENINLIIREMWRKIYRGNDIDYIEIKTESSMTNDSERRKYDYRVVQCKNGAEIDMRGRCSAGQKVLACLIIRLALAETFSAKFGILALDEPTTNLDEENVKSLCSALGDIVQERMNQKNFMFIIITHDKEFIESLGAIDKVTHYYEVSRNEEGRSRVKKIRFT